MGPELEAAGLNLAAVLPIADYDRTAPRGWSSRQLLTTARCAVVIGAGCPSMPSSPGRSPAAASG
jgi:hypothetical protein